MRNRSKNCSKSDRSCSYLEQREVGAAVVVRGRGGGGQGAAPVGVRAHLLVVAVTRPRPRHAVQGQPQSLSAKFPDKATLDWQLRLNTSVGI